MSAHAVWSVYFFAVGACVGSFLNVVIYRLPKKESLVRPGSRCPACSSPIRWWNNIPIVSYFLLRGRCADCGVKFSARYLMVEALTGLLFAACFVRFGLTAEAALYFAFAAALVAIAFIDIDHMIIPDAITLPGIPVGLICSSILPLSLLDAVSGMLLGGGILFIIALIVPHGMGGGDVKLLGMVGAFLGWKAALITIFLGALVGSAGGIIGMVALGKGRKAKIPFGPYLAVGALLSMFFEREIIDFYIRLAMP
jgi:leader peptidase (prepilin peptidase)/N-methyltransferase